MDKFCPHCKKNYLVEKDHRFCDVCDWEFKDWEEFKRGKKEKILRWVAADAVIKSDGLPPQTGETVYF